MMNQFVVIHMTGGRRLLMELVPGKYDFFWGLHQWRATLP
jgi:hypothetical protein